MSSSSRADVLRLDIGDPDIKTKVLFFLLDSRLRGNDEKMPWQKIAETIPRDAKNISQNASIDSSQVCKSWHEYATKFLLGGAMRAHEAINFRDGVLTISVTDATYLTDIRYRERKIIRLLNQALGANLVKTIRYLA